MPAHGKPECQPWQGDGYGLSPVIYHRLVGSQADYPASEIL